MCGCEAAVATRTASSTIALKKTPNACTAEPATLAAGLRTRASTKSRPWTNRQSTPARADRESGEDRGGTAERRQQVSGLGPRRREESAGGHQTLYRL